MDTPRDAQEYDAMDFTESNTRFAVDALALLSKTKDAEVLDVGTGTARIPILMLDRAPGLKVLAQTFDPQPYGIGVPLDKEGQKANWSKRPLTKKLLDYAALDVWYLPALRELLKRDLVKLKRFSWFEQQCKAQIAAGSEGFAPATDHDWRIGKSERLQGFGIPCW